jgi:hypothetical protein
LILNGGLGVAKNVNIGGTLGLTGLATLVNADVTTLLRVTSNTEATASNNGSVQISGGVGIALSCHVGNALTIYGKTTCNGNFQSKLAVANANVQVASPAAGATVTIGNDTPGLVINVGSTLATLTIAFPSTGILDGQRVFITTTQVISAITYSGATFATNMTPPSSLAAAQSIEYIYVSANGTWFRLR